MKNFEIPKIKLVKFAVEDVITTSSDVDFPLTPLTIDDDLGIVDIGS